MAMKTPRGAPPPTRVASPPRRKRAIPWGGIKWVVIWGIVLVLILGGLWWMGQGQTTATHSGIVTSRYAEGILFGLWGNVFHLIIKNGTVLSDVKVGPSIYYGLQDGQTYNWSITDTPGLFMGLYFVFMGFTLPLILLKRELFRGWDM